MREHSLPPTIEEIVALLEEIQNAEWAEESIYFDDEELYHEKDT